MKYMTINNTQYKANILMQIHMNWLVTHTIKISTMTYVRIHTYVHTTSNDMNRMFRLSSTQ